MIEVKAKFIPNNKAKKVVIMIEPFYIKKLLIS